MMDIKNTNGYIAIISVIIISMVLLTATITLSLTGFLNRFNILEGEAKEISIGLATACVESARIKIARDLNYFGDETINVGERSCTIISVTDNGSTVQVVGEYKGATTRYEAILDSEQNIFSLMEVGKPGS